jgi:hypothetical protein
MPLAAGVALAGCPAATASPPAPQSTPTITVPVGSPSAAEAEVEAEQDRSVTAPPIGRFHCFAIAPEGPSSATSLCKDSKEDCALARSDQQSAGEHAGECEPRAEAFCMSYAFDDGGERLVHEICMGDLAGCEALRRTAANDSHAKVRNCRRHAAGDRTPRNPTDRMPDR